MGKNRSVADVQRDLLHRLQTEGVEVAYETALALCRDPKAASQAKSAALNALFRAGGYFDKREPIARKELHEMDGAELQEAVDDILRRFGKQAAEDTSNEADAEEDEGIFG